MSTTPSTEDCNASTSATCVYSGNDDNACISSAGNRDTHKNENSFKSATVFSEEHEEQQEIEPLEQSMVQEQLEQTKCVTDNVSYEQEHRREQGISTKFNEPVNNNEVVELTPELTLANVPVFDGRVELPNAASIGGHHLSLTEGRIFMKQSCSRREERFYELIKSYQQELVERAMAHASSVIHQYVQKGVPDALEQSFNMYIEREHQQQQQQQQQQQHESSKGKFIVNDNSACNKKSKNLEPCHSNVSICSRSSNADDVVECARHTSKNLTTNCELVRETKKMEEKKSSEPLKTSIATEKSKSTDELFSRVLERENECDKQQKIASGLMKTASSIQAGNVSIDELNKCGSGQSVVNGSFNSVSLYDYSTIEENEDNVLVKESVENSSVEKLEEMKIRREKRIAATLWWTVMAHEYQGNEENRESTLSDVGVNNSNNNNGEQIEFLSSTPTDVNVLGTVDNKKESDRIGSGAACAGGHLSTHSSANAVCCETQNNNNVNESSTTSSFIRTWQQNNVIDDGHYETTYEVQRQVMNNGSFASNITTNTNTSGKAVYFRSPTSKLPQAMRSPSVNSHNTTMLEVQSAQANKADTEHALWKESPLQDKEISDKSCDNVFNHCQERGNKREKNNEIKSNNDMSKEKSNEECKALGDSRGSNVAQDECASVVTAYSSVSTRPTAAEVEKARALHWLAPFIPRYFGIRRVRLSTITELGVPRACLNGWSVDSKDIAERVEQSKGAAKSSMESKVDVLNNTETQTKTSPLVDTEWACDELTTERECQKDSENKCYKNKKNNDSNNGSVSSNNSSRKNSVLRAAKRKKTPLRFRFSISSIPQNLGKKSVIGSINSTKGLNDPYCEMIAMEDVCYHFAHPCVLDMKMGSRQYGLHPTATKKKSKEKKSLQSTSAKYGIRLAGYRRWNEQTQTYDKKSKLECRSLTLTELKKELYTFLQENRQMEHMFRKQVENLRIVFSKQTVFRFYTSSLLFVYDADDPLKTGRIVMVDFAYTYEKDELIQDNDPEASFAYDVGYLKALDTLLSLLA